MKPVWIGFDMGREDGRTLTLDEIYDVSTYGEARISVRHMALAGRKSVLMLTYKDDSPDAERPCPVCGNLKGLCPSATGPF